MLRYTPRQPQHPHQHRCGFAHDKTARNSAVFNEWFAKILLPELPKGAVVILDNARFHKSKALRKLAKAAGITLLFLPPYSPQDNLIEHEWFPIKNTARKILQTFHDLPAAVETALLLHD